MDENLKKIKEELEENEAFRGFVEKYCEKHGIDQDTALTHALVKYVGDTYREMRLEEEGRNE